MCPYTAMIWWGLGWEGIMEPTPQENMAFARRLLTDVVVSGDTDAVEAFITEDIADHILVFREDCECEPMNTVGWRVLPAADIGIKVEGMATTADRVAVRGPVTSTHRGPLMDRASTRASVEIAYMWDCRMKPDKSTSSGHCLTTSDATIRCNSQPA